MAEQNKWLIYTLSYTSNFDKGLKRAAKRGYNIKLLENIIQELEKPGRDPRSGIKVFEFDANVKTISDLRTGMELPGIVTNITNFGAFVDIGIKENGLVHISNMSDRYISNPAEVVSVHQHVKVRIMEVDAVRKRVQLKLLQS